MNDISDTVPPIIVAALYVFVPLTVLFVVSRRTGREQWEDWKKFAIANHVNFHSGSFRVGGTISGPRIEGVYRGHNLEIAADKEGQSFCTRVELKANSPISRQEEGIVWDMSTSPAPEDVLNLLTPNGLYDIADGKIELRPLGENLWYRQGGVLTNVNKMQRVCNLLADLADRYSAVASIGGTAVSSLQTISRQNNCVSDVAVQLLRDIAQDTRERLGPRTERLICPRCLVRCGVHRADLPMQFDETYYGCRLCYQSREFIDCPNGVVAVLDSGWADAQAQQDGSLRVNWLARRALFDFDRVEIAQASDEDVERFAVQVGNDADPLRRPRYAEMRCVVRPVCGLSENTLRVLESTFGQVQQIAG